MGRYAHPENESQHQFHRQVHRTTNPELDATLRYSSELSAYLRQLILLPRCDKATIPYHDQLQ